MNDSDLASQLKELRRDFTVRTDQVEFEVDGELVKGSIKVVEFQLPLPGGYSILIDYMLNLGGCEKNLYLCHDDADSPMLMGWWDLQSWHPYCLRTEELDRLLRYWEDQEDLDPDLPLLLLADFVGMETPASSQALQERVAEAYARLSDDPLPCPAEIHAKDEDDYQWTQDEEFGWIFHSEEYPCYSLRNRAHIDSGEGCFPFLAFNRCFEAPGLQPGA